MIHPPDVEERFWAGVLIGDPADCWEWTVSVNTWGYGQFSAVGKHFFAHRVAYEIAYGEIPPAYRVDHLCRNRACVNPNHLEAVTHAENIRRGYADKNQTHCKRGHPFDEANTRIGSTGNRNCRACEALRRTAKWDLAPDDPRHGTVNAYRHGCRCPRCKAASADYHRAWRHASPERMEAIREYQRHYKATKKGSTTGGAGTIEIVQAGKS